MHFQHLEELLFPCSKVHLPPPLYLALPITLQKELNKTKLVKTWSSTFYPFESLQTDEVALISLSSFVDKEKALKALNEDEKRIFGKELLAACHNVQLKCLFPWFFFRITQFFNAFVLSIDNLQIVGPKWHFLLIC